jgi:hypothetical protein
MHIPICHRKAPQATPQSVGSPGPLSTPVPSTAIYPMSHVSVAMNTDFVGTSREDAPLIDYGH